MSDWIKCHESVHEEIWRNALASRDAEVESMRKNFQDKEMADLMETGRLKLELAALTKECAGLYADSDKLQKALYTMESEVARLTAALEEGVKRACWVALEFRVNRYLMSCAPGREDGNEKADVHREMCKFLMAAWGIEGHETFERIHTKTQELTGWMDAIIGFPQKGRPDYDKLAPKFFDKFYELAALSRKGEPQ